jgi:hypothetical protein
MGAGELEEVLHRVFAGRGRDVGGRQCNWPAFFQRSHPQTSAFALNFSRKPFWLAEIFKKKKQIA